MNIQAGLTGAALVFWGWQCGQWIPALAVGVLLEGMRWSSIRWEFPGEDVRRITGLCLLLLLGVAAFIFGGNEGGEALSNLFRVGNTPERATSYYQVSTLLLRVVQQLPWVFLPLAIAQSVSAQPKLDFTATTIWLRRRRLFQTGAGPVEQSPVSANVSFPYFAVCLVGASATNRPGLGYFFGFCALLGWAAWPRTRRITILARWTALLLVAAGLGFSGQVGLRGMRDLFRDLTNHLVSRFSGTRSNLDESRTAMGSIGRLKLSSRIALRIRSPERRPPVLFRDACFNGLRSNIWYRLQAPFDPLIPEEDLTTWILASGESSAFHLDVFRYLSGRQGPLGLPAGAARILEFKAGEIKTNRLGTVKVEQGPGLAAYKVDYGSGKAMEGEPDSTDLDVPESERSAIDEIATDLDLDGIAPERVVSVVAGFFERKFRYTTYLDTGHQPTNGLTALGVFLTRNRSGHCEYFATATALLLRRAGVPTRYVTGYAVQEGSKEKGFVARQRDAHAWCLAYVGGRWVDIDNTPGTWRGVEEANASWSEPLQDVVSNLWFRFSVWRWTQTEFRKYFMTTAVVLLAVLGARLIYRKPWKRASQGSRAAVTPLLAPGHDSEFYQVGESLISLGWSREPGETFGAWFTRVERPASLRIEPLGRLLRLHNRLRFDPGGLRCEEREELRSGVVDWLRTLDVKR